MEKISYFELRLHFFLHSFSFHEIVKMYSFSCLFYLFQVVLVTFSIHMQGTSKNISGCQFSYETHSILFVAIDQINPDGFMFIIFLHICVPYADDKAKLWVTVESQLKRRPANQIGVKIFWSSIPYLYNSSFWKSGLT